MNGRVWTLEFVKECIPMSEARKKGFVEQAALGIECKVKETRSNSVS